MYQICKPKRFIGPFLAALGAIGCVSPALAAHADGNAASGISPLWTQPIAKAKAALLPVARAGGPRAAKAQRELGLIAMYEDDSSGALDRWLPIFTTSNDTALQEMHWSQFSDVSYDAGRRAVLGQAAKALLTKANVTPFLRETAQDNLGLYLDNTAHIPQADAHWRALGYIRNWQVIGPFENEALGGFDKPAPPEQGIDFKATYPGHSGLMLHWFPEKLVDRDASVHIGTTLGGEGASCYYAVTAVQAGADGTQALLNYSVCGASKVYVNGVLVAKDTIYRFNLEHNAAPWQVPVSLRRGWNTILLKIADDENKTGEFRLRLTSRAGALLSLPVDPTKADSGAVTEPAGVAAPTSVVFELLNARIAKDPDDIEARYYLGLYLRASGDNEGSATALRAALARAPNSGILHWELHRTLIADEQRDAANAERDRAIALDDHIVFARLNKLADQKKSLKPGERVAAYKQLLVSVNPNSPDTLMALAQAEADAELKEQALPLIDQVLKIEPSRHNYETVFSFLGSQNTITKLMARMKESVAFFPDDPEFLAATGMLDSATGDAEGAKNLFLRALQSNEVPTPYRVQLAEFYTEQHLNALAAAQLNLAHQEEPQDSDICAKLADCRSAMGESQTAIALYKEAVRLDPSHVTLRDKLQLLTGAKPVADLAPATDTAATIANLGKTPPPAGASEVRLLDEGRLVVYPDYARVLYNHEIITVLDKAAVQKYQYYRFPLSSGTASATLETARLIKANHEIVDCKDQAQSNYAAFPSLAVGDTIDLAVRVEDYPTGGLAGTLCSEWYFQKLAGPLQLSRFVVVTPKDMPLTVQPHGGAGDPSVTESGDWKVREWRVSDMSVAPADPFGLPYMDAGPWVDISTVGSWKQIVDWYRTISAPQCVADPAVAAKAVELTQNAKTDDDKIRAIVEYVAQKVQYQSSPFRMSAFVPTPGKKVLRDSYGDCKDKAALVTAMLGKVGIVSHMALLSPRNFGVTPYLPGPRFAHAIAVVDTAKGPLWVDATADALGFGVLPEGDQDVPALVIQDGVTDLTHTPIAAVDQTTMTETSTATLDEHGNLTGTYDLSAVANDGWGLRGYLRQFPENQRISTMTQVFSGLLAGARVSEPAVSGITETDVPLDMHCAYQAPDYAQAADDLLITKVPWATRWTGEASLLTALHATPHPPTDVETGSIRGKRVAHLEYTLPKGYTVKNLKPEVTGNAPFGSYKFTYRMDGGKLIAEREVVINSMRIAAADAPKFMDFEDAIVKQMTAPLILQKQ